MERRATRTRKGAPSPDDGAPTRLRPVFDDAAGSLASFQGHSIGASAEVQQPLATVVIGWIISSPVAPGAADARKEDV